MEMSFIAFEINLVRGESAGGLWEMPIVAFFTDFLYVTAFTFFK